MSCKRKGGFVFVVLALFVFSGFFVSAEYYTQNVFSGSFVFAYNIFEVFNVPSPMIGSNVTISVKTTEGVCPVYIDYSYLNGADTLDPYPVNVNSSQVAIFTQEGFDSTRVVKSFTIHTSSVSGCTSKLNVTSVSLVGKYYNASVDNLIVPITNKHQNPIKTINYATLLTLSKPLVVTNLSVKVNNLNSVGCYLYVNLLDSQGTQITSPIISADYILGLASNVVKYSVGVPGGNLQTAPLTYQINLHSSCDSSLNLTEVSLDGFYPDGQIPCTPNGTVISGTLENYNSTHKVRYDYDSCGRIVGTFYTSIPECTANSTEYNTSWYAYNNTHQRMNVTDSCGDLKREYYRAKFESCFTSDKCQQSGTSVQMPSSSDVQSCDYGSTDCVKSINRASALNVVWQRVYMDGTEDDPICTCDSTSPLQGFVTYVSAGNTLYDLPIFTSVSNGKVLKELRVWVLGVSGSSKSAPISDTINIFYPCSNSCNFTGQNLSVVGFDNKYKTCVQNLNNVCFSWSVQNYTCPISFPKFDSTIGRCSSGRVSNCAGDRYFCSNNPLKNFGNAQGFSNLNCSLESQSCFQCNPGYHYDSAHGLYGACVLNNCLNNCTSAGGLCSVAVPSEDNLAINNNYTCCTDESCYTCAADSHVYNNTCVLDVCMGSKPSLDTANVTFGANNTRDSSVFMNWTYIDGIAGACQWNCSFGMEINLSTNNSCQIIQKKNCTSVLGGICSNVSISNAFDNSIRGNCSSSFEKCYACSPGFTNVNNVCIASYASGACEAKGLISNGIQCVENKECGSGKCRFLTKNNKTTCVQAGFNFKDGEKIYFCDISSSIFKSSLSVGSECTFNSQCETNFCFRNQTTNKSICYNLNQASALREFFIEFVCWFRNVGNVDARNECKTAAIARLSSAQSGS